MPDSSGADPTRRSQKGPAGGVSRRIAVPLRWPRPDIAPLRHPRVRSGPKDSDLRLFEGTGTARGAAGTASGAYGAGSEGAGEGRRWKALPQGRVVVNTLLVGVVAVACGVGLVMLAGPSERRVERASSPGADLGTAPQLPGFAAGTTDDIPGDVTEQPRTPPADASESASASGHSTDKPPAASSTSGSPSGTPAGQGDGGAGKDTGEDRDNGENTGGDTGHGAGAAPHRPGAPAAPATRERAMQAVNYPDRYWHVRDGVGLLEQVDRRSALITVTDGLAGSGCYSFSLGEGRYLRHRDFRLRADTDDGSSLFKKDATFCSKPGVYDGSVMFESYNFPGRFIRHRDFRLRLERYEHNGLYLTDASFRMLKG